MRYNLLPLNPLKEILVKGFPLLSGLFKKACARKPPIVAETNVIKPDSSEHDPDFSSGE